MTDQEFKNYLEKRCSQETFEVPAFDRLFSEDELAARPTGHSAFLLWSSLSFTAAAAAAIALFILLKPAETHNQDQLGIDNWVVSDVLTTSESDIASCNEEVDPNVIYNPIIVRQTKQSKDSHTLKSDNNPKTTPNDSLYDRQSDEFMTVNATLPDSLTSGNSKSAQQEPNTPHRDLIWEQNIESARMAKKQKKQATNVSLAFNCSNSLSTSQSASSTVSRNYPSRGSLRSGEASNNEWEVPGNLNLTSAELSSYPRTFNLPLSGSLGVTIPLFGRWNIKTGITYTYLSANTQGNMESGQSFSLSQHLHYLGIPVAFSCNIIDRAFGLYVSAGGGVEKGLAGVQYSHVYSSNGEQTSSQKLTQSVAGLQPYVSAAIGASYQIAKQLQVYIEPCLSYYFDTGQPVCVRTSRPLYVGLGAGFRFVTSSKD